MVKCKSKLCDLERGHKGKCYRVVKPVATSNVATKSVATDEKAKLNGRQELKETRLATPRTATRAEAGRLVSAPPDRLSEVTRVQKWRESNRERYNARMKEYRRKRRAAHSEK